jgi:phage regulator Rha-like protein
MDNSYMVKELHYLDEQGKERPFYMLSKKVAIGLIIAYTGQKAFKVRLQILDRFDELEKEQVDKKKVFAGSKGGYKGQFERVKAENEDLKLKVEELEKQNQEYLDSALDSETKLNIALKGMLKIAEAIAEIQNK